MKNTADIVLKSSSIFTAADDRLTDGGVAIKGNRIMAVGSADSIDGYVSETTKIYDFGDKLIMPGFVDGHDHLWWGAVADSDHMVDLTGSASEEEALQMIKEYADSHPDEKRIRGFGWFPANWNDAPLPTKESLDRIVPDRPAYMNCADAHTCWLNSKALEACGVTSLSEMSADDYKDFYHNRYRTFKSMADNGEFTSRVHVYTALMGHTDFSTAQEWAEEFSSDTFRVSGLKGFLDGVTSTYTGYMLEPYTDKPETCGEGVPLATKESLEASVIAGNAAGLPVRIHCIGDAAVRMALDAFEASIRVNGKHGLRNSIEHIETIDPDDIGRFRELDVIASMQGEHLPLDNNEKPARVGMERCRWEWPFRSILDSGATLAFGTDFPVVKYNQLPGIYAAVSRKNYDGSPAGAENGEILTLAEALTANTLGSAKVYGREHELGTLEAGKLADVIVLDRDLFAVPAEEIKDAKVILTIVDGRVTFERYKTYKEELFF